MACSDLLQQTASGLYCPAGGFFIDPSRPVPRAVVTHAHSDHARWGCRHYLAAKAGESVFRLRLDRQDSPIENRPEFDFVGYGESRSIGGVRVTLHPAGHMLGSAQVRLEQRGRVVVVTGDYKLEEDPTCAAWEPIPCDGMVTESTFGLPIYRWPAQESVHASINEWWRASAQNGQCCVLYGYAVGKAQRLLACLDASIGPIYTHGAVENGVRAYRAAGVALPVTERVSDQASKHAFRGAMVVAVPSAHGTPWMRRFGSVTTAMASGWMAIRGARRRRAVDRGFVLSDHVDWPGLLSAIEQNDPEEVWVTHGSSAVVARYLEETTSRRALAIDRPRSESDEDPAESNASHPTADDLDGPNQ
ncbi:MAG: ligase-associated DNA damage response exonuclease [Planctomycetota bacterium]